MGNLVAVHKFLQVTWAIGFWMSTVKWKEILNYLLQNKLIDILANSSSTKEQGRSLHLSWLLKVDEFLIFTTGGKPRREAYEPFTVKLFLSKSLEIEEKFTRSENEITLSLSYTIHNIKLGNKGTHKLAELACLR